MAQVTISGPDGTLLFFCRGGETALTNLPDSPSVIEAPHVSTAQSSLTYGDVQKQIDNLHTQTMDFFSKWLKLLASTNTNLAPTVVTIEEKVDEEEEDNGQLDLDVGGDMSGPRTAGEKSDRN